MAEEAVPEAQRTRTATRAKRYAHSGLGNMCAQKHMNHCSFGTQSRETKMSPQSDRAKRYAQCVFVCMNAFKRVMSQHRVNFFCNFAKVKPNSANVKTLKTNGNMCKT